MAGVEEYTMCVYLRMVRNAAPLHKEMIDLTGKSAYMQLEGEVLDYYANAAANQGKY